VDYAEIEFLAEMNRSLLRECDDDSLLKQLDRNLQLAKELQQEIVAEASRHGANPSKDTTDAATTHLQPVFSVLSAK
jgi:hypothetical protein